MRKLLVLLSLLLLLTSCSRSNSMDGKYYCGRELSISDDLTELSITAVIKNGKITVTGKSYNHGTEETVNTEMYAELIKGNQLVFDVKVSDTDSSFLKDTKLFYDSKLNAIDFYNSTLVSDQEISKGLEDPDGRCIRNGKSKININKSFEITKEIYLDHSKSFDDVYVYTGESKYKPEDDYELEYIFMPKLNALAQFTSSSITVSDYIELDDFYYIPSFFGSRSFSFEEDYSEINFMFDVYINNGEGIYGSTGTLVQNDKTSDKPNYRD